MMKDGAKKQKRTGKPDGFDEYVVNLHKNGGSDVAYEFSKRINTELSSMELSIFNWMVEFAQTPEQQNNRMYLAKPSIMSDEQFINGKLMKKYNLHKPKPLPYTYAEIEAVVEKVIGFANSVGAVKSVDDMKNIGVDYYMLYEKKLIK